MSRSRRSNPFDYRLPLMKSWDGNPAAFKPYEKRVRLICKSFMKRARAAYKRAEEGYTGDNLKNLTNEACDLEEHINSVYEWVMQNLPPRAIRWEDGRTLTQVATEHIKYVNDGIQRMHREIQDFERRSYPAWKLKHRRHYQSDPAWRDLQLAQTRQYREYVRKLYLALRTEYPYVRVKYRNRLMRLAIVEVERGNKTGRLGERYLSMTELLQAGIPASDIVGPWWPRTPDIKSPMDYIDWTDRHSDIPVQSHYGRTHGVARQTTDYQSPSVDDWLHTFDLDGSDRELREACTQYYLRHKVAPSVKWAQERSNQLEEERKKKEIKKQIEPVATWLKISAQMAAPTPALLKAWRVVKPNDAEELCLRAQRDGLCVVDVLTHIIDQAADHVEHHGEEGKEDRDFLAQVAFNSVHEGVCTLLFSTDPTRRTIVGLNEKGICTSQHHCTGKNNEVDEEAWSYFRDQ